MKGNIAIRSKFFPRRIKLKYRRSGRKSKGRRKARRRPRREGGEEV